MTRARVPLFAALAAAGLLLADCGGANAAQDNQDKPAAQAAAQNGAAAPDPAALVAALEKMAAAGNGEASYHLGMAYHLGNGVPQDKAKALDAFRKSAELGDPLGAYKLGCYYDGQGEGLVKEDDALALKYKLVAAEAGYALAQQDVGILYGEKSDFNTALGWIAQAAAQGWPDALRIYASIHNGAAGIPKDAATTDAYFTLALRMTDGGDAKQRAWLTAFEAKMSAQDKARADQLVAGYRPAPTALTRKALAGQRAAEELVAAATPD
ncbi:tetratricopeptide repeat protein [Sphingobium nicotianae]|uniref:Sel1 repeat family protein n=1 Tax=Sphingobium nicotianae TaxID=2782607 RepID=A0A9X1DFB2_9SPHN|nr:tetratricopeptide repeat protein [Sphingobium nicotianae]MBT2189212.1 sel1 repeat family protein [Sphingobium nicotianae]